MLCAACGRRVRQWVGEGDSGSQGDRDQDDAPDGDDHLYSPYSASRSLPTTATASAVSLPGPSLGQSRGAGSASGRDPIAPLSPGMSLALIPEVTQEDEWKGALGSAHREPSSRPALDTSGDISGGYDGYTGYRGDGSWYVYWVHGSPVVAPVVYALLSACHTPRRPPPPHACVVAERLVQTLDFLSRSHAPPPPPPPPRCHSPWFATRPSPNHVQVW